MKKILFACILLLAGMNSSFAQKKSTSVSAKDMGIGVRLGDPSGVTFKKYFGNTALELNGGIPTYVFSGYNYDYYYDSDYYYKHGYYGYHHDRGFGFAFQAHVLQHFDIKPVSGLQWYAGAGLQLRTISYKYYYYDALGNPHTDRETHAQFGLDALGGAEYTFDGLPFSVFADLNFFINFVNNAGVYVQPGIGGRYNF